MHELWVWDEDREDFTTIKFVADGPVIEGEIHRRNLFAKGLQPLSEVCPNPSQESFWGFSECNQTRHLQTALNSRLRDIMRLLDKQVKRKKAFIGFDGLTWRGMPNIGIRSA